MNIESFDWDEGNIQHIGRHQVDSDEAEEVFASWFHLLKSHSGRYIALGQTVSGRYLTCIFERCEAAGMVRIVTARDMNQAERRLYKRRRPL